MNMLKDIIVIWIVFQLIITGLFAVHLWNAKYFEYAENWEYCRGEKETPKLIGAILPITTIFQFTNLKIIDEICNKYENE